MSFNLERNRQEREMGGFWIIVINNSPLFTNLFIILTKQPSFQGENFRLTISHLLKDTWIPEGRRPVPCFPPTPSQTRDDWIPPTGPRPVLHPSEKRILNRTWPWFSFSNEIPSDLATIWEGSPGRDPYFHLGSFIFIWCVDSRDLFRACFR